MTALLVALLLAAVVVIALQSAALRRVREDAAYWRGVTGIMADTRRREQAMREKTRTLRRLETEAAR